MKKSMMSKSAKHALPGRLTKQPKDKAGKMQGVRSTTRNGKY